MSTSLTPATAQKREQLLAFIERNMVRHAAVQAVIGIGSIAFGTMQPGSDIDAVVFLEPLDLYIVPAEAIWRASDDTFHSIFTQDAALQRDGVQLDFNRLDFGLWRDTSFDWPEPMRAELGSGWIAFDRTGEATRLIAERNAYPDERRIAQLDEAITWLDQHLDQADVQQRWSALGPAVAHDRLQAAYDYLVQALFAYNRRWRIWRNREMTVLLQLPWLPDGFERRVLGVAVAQGHGERAYMRRAKALRRMFGQLLQQLTADGVYGEAPIDEAFIRAHEEPGRAWNMREWSEKRRVL